MFGFVKKQVGVHLQQCSFLPFYSIPLSFVILFYYMLN